ncbi:hypothetical protein SDJN02_13384, partial [Cucurbita argyrosperma subsp. argyrosperma]
MRSKTGSFLVMCSGVWSGHLSICVTDRSLFQWWRFVFAPRNRRFDMRVVKFMEFVGPYG